ncbi:hypothetical protein COL0001_04340 [Helicobacter pylori]
MRSSYDFLAPTDEVPECVLVPKELGRKFKAEVEVARLARQNRPRFRIKDNLFSDSSDGGLRGYIRSRIRGMYSRYRIPHTARITLSMDEIERWEKEALEQGLGNSLKPKKENKSKKETKKEKVSKTLLAKALANTTDTDASYCFISDLAAQLDNISLIVSKSIITAIEQAEGVRLTYALIDKILYNSLHNILSFVFDNVKLPQIKNALAAQIFEGVYQFKS